MFLEFGRHATDNSIKWSAAMHLIGEVIKQFEFDVTSLPHSVKGKIVKYVSENGDVNYRWSISHHYKPSATAIGVYFPSRGMSPSLEEAEMDFRAYAQVFVADYEVVANDYF